MRRFEDWRRAGNADGRDIDHPYACLLALDAPAYASLRTFRWAAG